MSIKNFNILILVLLFSLISLVLVSATLNVSLSDQGTEVTNTSSGALLTSGDLIVTIYDALTGGSLIYTETFSGAIGNGSWNVMLGEVVNLPLEFGRVYYKDYSIAGEDASFVNGTGQTVGRQFFYSPLGDINSSKLFGIIKVLGSKVGIGTDTPSSTLEVNGTLGLNSFTSLGNDTGYTFKNVNGTLYWNATTISAAFNGSTNATAGELGLVPVPSAGEQGQCLKGDGTWGDCGSDFSCPTGFTMIENNGYQMGCIQNTRQGTGVAGDDCQEAIVECYSVHGGRLPTYNEIYIAAQNYSSSLTDEGVDEEWIDSGYLNGAQPQCGLIEESVASYSPSGNPFANDFSFRCFIPAGGGGGASGGAFYGSLKWDVTTNCGWTTSSSTFSNLAADIDCDDNARTARGLTTSVVTAADPEGQIPQIKFDSMPAGYYFVRATGYYNSNNAETCYWKFTDGSQNTTSNSIGGGVLFAGGGTVEGEFFFASDQGATTLTLQATRQSTNTCELSVAAGTGVREFEIAVYYFPSFGTAKSDTVFSDLDGDTKINVDGDGSDSDNMTFFTAGIERMRIDSLGNVDIGGTLYANSSDYFLSEIDTGAKWIDGKTIYRRVYVVPDISSAGASLEITLGSTVDTAINIGGYVIELTSNDKIFIGAGVGDSAGAAASVSARITTSGTKLQLDANGGLDWQSGHVWIEYTK